MKLDISNIGGIRLKPYGESALTTYGWGTVDRSITVNGTTAHVIVRKPWEIPAGENPSGMLMPGFSESDKPILEINDRIFVPEVSILQSDSSDEFEFGGYLGTKTHTFTFRDGEGHSGSTTIRTLGVIPAEYNGGIVLDGIDKTSDQMYDIKMGDDFVYSRANLAWAFTANGKEVDFMNFRMSPSFNTSWVALFSCGIGYDVYLTDINRLN